MSQSSTETRPSWIKAPSDSQGPSPELQRHLKAALRTLQAQVRRGRDLPRVTTENMYRHLGAMPPAPQLAPADPPELESAALEDVKSFVEGLLLAEDLAHFDEG